jgi:hypothetical protein
MTFYYRTTTTSSGNQQVSEETKAFWEHASEKKNWRIVQLPNGYYQTELLWEDSWKDVTRRETIGAAEEAIDLSIEHYRTKLDFIKGPKVVKTFE